MRLLLLVILIMNFTSCCDHAGLGDAKRGLYNPDPKVRNESALALASCSAEAGDSVGRLGQLLYDRNVGVQSSAAFALRKIDNLEARAILKKAEERKEKSR